MRYGEQESGSTEQKSTSQIHHQPLEKNKQKKTTEK